jgi:hypothetical protein
VNVLALAPCHLVRPELARLIERTALEINDAKLLAEGLVPDGLVGGEFGGKVAAVGAVLRIVDLYGGLDPFFGSEGIEVQFGGEVGNRGCFGELVGCRSSVLLGGQSGSFGCCGCGGGLGKLFFIGGSLSGIFVGVDLMFMCMLVVVVVLLFSSGRRRGLNLDDLDDGLSRLLSSRLLSSGLLSSGLRGSRLLCANSFVDRRNKSGFRSSSFFLGDERRRLVAVPGKTSD